MALKGTIKDFGVADIFQLISQQAKTGVLVLSNDVDAVRVYFKDGSVVRAENTTRPAQMLLGNFMVRAAILPQERLDQALKEQAKTLKRIGAVLVDLGLVTAEVVTEFATMQLTETIYQLFEWKVGTYEFESVEVEPSPEGVKPIRAETIVMNGIRMTDEWPGIRERIPAYSWKVERMRALPPPPERPKRSEDEFDFSSFEGGDGPSGDIDGIGSYERKIYGLIGQGRTVQNLIDLSRLGEFEACRALSTLVGEGYIRIVKPGDPETVDVDRDTMGARARRLLEAGARIGISSALVVLAAWLLTRAPTQLGWRDPGSAARYQPQVVAAHVCEAQLRVLRRALDVYRITHGSYPDKLEALVEAGLVREQDLNFPYEGRYFYALDAGAISLLPPLR